MSGPLIAQSNRPLQADTPKFATPKPPIGSSKLEAATSDNPSDLGVQTRGSVLNPRSPPFIMPSTEGFFPQDLHSLQSSLPNDPNSLTDQCYVHRNGIVINNCSSSADNHDRPYVTYQFWMNDRGGRSMGNGTFMPSLAQNDHPSAYQNTIERGGLSKPNSVSFTVDANTSQNTLPDGLSPQDFLKWRRAMRIEAGELGHIDRGGLIANNGRRRPQS
jgi:hypothetical protein